MAAPVQSTSVGVATLFKTLEDNIQLISKEIKDGERLQEENSVFEKDKYWSTVGSIFSILSRETTKISLAFSKKPFPSNKNTEAMVTELEKAMLTLVSIFFSFPNSQGKTLRAHFQSAVLKIMENLQNFASAVNMCICADSDTQRLQWTGGVWEAADFTLLKDNKSCCLKKLKEVSELVNDALGEIEEVEENDGRVDDPFLEDQAESNSGTWSEQDRLVVIACSGLVKTMKSVMKKSRDSVQANGESDTADGVACLDEVVTLTSGVNSAVDDFVCCVYAPVNYTALQENGKALHDVTGNILKFLRDSPLTTEADVKWLDFLTLANTHNLSKLVQSMATSPQGDGHG